tara:strand:- start:41 stop:253 length:213 start_codon:yes stop_codon:yes gene_type:complete
MNILIFAIGLAIFVTYMYFLVRMINTQHKIQEKENGKVEKVRIRKAKRSQVEIGSSGEVEASTLIKKSNK